MATPLDARGATVTNPGGVSLGGLDVSKPSGANMKGFTVVHLMEHMDSLELDGSMTWRQTLPPSVRPQVDRRLLTSVSWVAMELYYDGVRWLADRHFGGARGALNVGHALASRDINAFFRFIFSLASAPTVMSLGGRFWRSYFDRSSLQVLTSSANDVVGEVRDWPIYDEAALYELQGSLVAWIEASRAKDMRVTKFEVVSPTVISFAATWK